MKPFHQGQLDVFCAVYAVLNGLRLVRDIRPSAARDLLHATLLELAAEPEAFHAFLHQQTDYYDLVDRLLEKQTRRLYIEVETPFPDATERVAPHALWTWIVNRLSGPPPRALLLRFVRFLPFDARPYIHHWTCAARVQDSTLHLFDSSLAEGSIRAVERDQVITDPADAACDKIRIEPSSLRLLTLPGTDHP